MRLLIVLLAYFSVFPVYAEALTAKADLMNLFHHENRLELKGHVEIMKPDLTLKSESMVIRYHEVDGAKQIKQATAEGSVFLEAEGNEGWSDRALYDADTDLLILSGNAKVKSAQGNLEGEQIEYNMTTKETRVIKGKASEQVRITFGEDSD